MHAVGSPLPPSSCSSRFSHERAVDLSRMNTNAAPYYRRKRRRMRNTKRSNKPTSTFAVSCYPRLDEIAQKKVVAIVTFFPAFETRWEPFGNTCRDSRDRCAPRQEKEKEKREHRRLFYERITRDFGKRRASVTFDAAFRFTRQGQVVTEGFYRGVPETPNSHGLVD